MHVINIYIKINAKDDTYNHSYWISLLGVSRNIDGMEIFHACFIYHYLLSVWFWADIGVKNSQRFSNKKVFKSWTLKGLNTLKFLSYHHWVSLLIFRVQLRQNVKHLNCFLMMNGNVIHARPHASSLQLPALVLQVSKCFHVYVYF